jgi:hypothetical protein
MSESLTPQICAAESALNATAAGTFVCTVQECRKINAALSPGSYALTARNEKGKRVRAATEDPYFCQEGALLQTLDAVPYEDIIAEQYTRGQRGRREDAPPVHEVMDCPNMNIEGFAPKKPTIMHCAGRSGCTYERIADKRGWASNKNVETCVVVRQATADARSQNEPAPATISLYPTNEASTSKPAPTTLAEAVQSLIDGMDTAPAQAVHDAVGSTIDNAAATLKETNNPLAIEAQQRYVEAHQLIADAVLLIQQGNESLQSYKDTL